jgi:staphyloferrin A synthase
VPTARWHTTGAGLPPRLPMHPWQWQRLRGDYPWLRSTGATLRGRPLLSLRTFAIAGWHLKTSIDAQMTSAVRIVSPAAVHNGPLMSHLLAKLTRRLPTFRVLREVAAGAVLVDGVPSRRLAVIQREAPRRGPAEHALPFAALAARTPEGRPLVVEVIRRGYAGAPRPLLADLTELLLPPLLNLLAMGVALEAHGQNLILVLRHGRPVRVVYRDLGGIRVSPRRLLSAGIDAPALAGDLITDDPTVLRTKLFAAAVTTVLGELVAVLSREYGEEPACLWRVVAGAIPTAAPDAAALFGATLPIKAMTAMRLSESPTDDLWASVPNPLVGAA